MECIQRLVLNLASPVLMDITNRKVEKQIVLGALMDNLRMLKELFHLHNAQVLFLSFFNFRLQMLAKKKYQVLVFLDTCLLICAIVSDIDNCASSPCFNGGSCISEWNNFRCTCPSGYYGKTCEEEKNECASKPCYGDAACVDKVNKYPFVLCGFV